MRILSTARAGLAAAAVSLAAATAGLAAGCGPGSGSSTSDAGADATSGSSADASVTQARGTTGQACASNVACQGDGGDAGSDNVCSTSITPTVDGVPAQLWPTPVCLVEPPTSGAGNCNPAPAATDPDGLKVHYCDGPDDPSSPGVCVAFAPSNPVTGLGTCYPQCTFSTDGSPAVGCIGHDTCVFLGYRLVVGAGSDAGTSILGVGYCQGSCQRNADCSTLGAVAPELDASADAGDAGPDADAAVSDDGGDAGSGAFACQQDLGYCTTQRVVRTKALGAACTAADSASGACNCFVGASGNGYCTTRCVVGGVACPSGWVCDTGEPAVASIFGSTMPTAPVVPTQGMAGTCAPACTLSADAGSDAAADAATPTDASAADANPADATTDAGEGDADAGTDATSAADASVADDAGDSATGSTDASAADAGDASGGVDAASASDAGADATPVGASASGACPQNSVCLGGGAAGADCLPQ